jgi:tripartite-type tricarboxylate transporter receptor subunit TctC
MKVIKIVSALAVSLLAAIPSYAQEYPNKTIRIVNNFPPGGPSDLLARVISDSLQTTFKQTVLVENKPGAGGNLGADVVAKSPADGYTILVGIDTTFTINPHIYANMPFKTADLKPLMILASSSLLLGTSTGSGIKDVKGLSAAGSSAKGLNFSSGGNGSPGHMAIEVLTEGTPLKIQHVPYKGNTPAVTAILASEVDGGILATPGMMPHIKAGKITPLAVTSAQRSKLIPELPTLIELGYKNAELSVLTVAMVPANTPESVMNTLINGIEIALKKPELQARLAPLDLNLEFQTGALATKRLADLSLRYGKLAKLTGMKPD